MRRPPAPPARLDLTSVLNALADPVRLHIVAQLRDGAAIACGAFDTTVSKSTLTYHFKTLREAGVITTDRDGSRAMNTLRKNELNLTFPGLIDCILDAYLKAENLSG